MPTQPQKTSLRIPPHNLEAEKSVLGSLMLDPNAIHIIADILKPEDFYEYRHSTIYQVMLELNEKREPIDVLSVSSRLKEKKLLKETGGNAYLTDLVNGVPTASNVKHYADIVREKNVLRSLIGVSNYISNLGFDEGADVEQALDEAEKKIFGIARYSVRQKFQSIKTALGEAWERIDRLHKSPGELRGIPTGFTELDNMLAGLQKSDLIILAARPAMGKTALALNIARNISCKSNIPVGVFSLEMSAQSLVDRLIASEAHVDSWRLRTGRLSSEQDFQRISDALDTLSKAPLFVDDEATNNIMQMRAMARRLQAEHGLGLLIVDYIQLMAPRFRAESAVQQMTEISRSLKALARELEVPILAISQLSRAVESRHDKRPKLHDLRDSGSIEQDADVVMFIYREDRYNQDTDMKNIVEILVEKHRNGPIGKLQLYFDPQKVSFYNIEKGDFGKI